MACATRTGMIVSDRDASVHPSASSPVNVVSLTESTIEHSESHDEELALDIQRGGKCFWWSVIISV